MIKTEQYSQSQNINILMKVADDRLLECNKKGLTPHKAVLFFQFLEGELLSLQAAQGLESYPEKNRTDCPWAPSPTSAFKTLVIW